MGKSTINAGRIAFFMILFLVLVSCDRFPATAPESCCTDISVNHLLDQAPIPHEQEEVYVMLRFDNRAVVANIVDRNHKLAYFNSYDGGYTWQQDALYHELRAWQNHIRRDSEIVPWDPNPADLSVRYRQIYFSEGKSWRERATDGGKSWTRMKGLILGIGVEIDEGGRSFYHPRKRLTLYKKSSVLGPEHRLFGMFVSRDGGDTFRFMYESGGSDVLAISHSNPDVMYGAGPGGSLLKSTDGGVFWDLVGQNDLIRKTRIRRSKAGEDTSGSPFDELHTRIDDIAIDPVDVNRVYLATSKGILRTENGGESWCLLGNTGITVANAYRNIVIVPTQPDVLFVGTYKGLMRSMDRGCHWEWIDILSRVPK